MNILEISARQVYFSRPFSFLRRPKIGYALPLLGPPGSYYYYYIIIIIIIIIVIIILLLLLKYYYGYYYYYIYSYSHY